MLARIKFGKNIKNLVVKSHAIHIAGGIVSLVKILVLFWQKVFGAYLRFVDHFKSINRANLSTDTAALAAIINTIDV